MTKFEDILKELNEIYEKKNADYGNSFEDSLNKYYILPTVLRLTEKITRLEGLYLREGQGLVKDESIEDTLKDIANYAIITVKWLKNKKE